MVKKLNMTRKNKFVLVVSFIAIIFFSVSNVFAEDIIDETNNKSEINDIIDIDAKETLYKFSDNEDIYLPFFRMSTDRVEIDKEVSNLGITYGNKGVDVNSKTQNLQFLFSNDTIRVNNSMEYVIIASSGNVIIDSNIDKTVVVFAGEKFTLTENANVNGDVICFSNSLEIKGNVFGSVVGSATNSIISGKVNKDFRISTESISISDNNNILGNLFIQTHNSSIELKDKYPNANIKLITTQSTSDKVIDILIGAIKTALVYTLAFLLIFKISKEKLFSNLLSVTKKNFGFSIISGTISLFAVPLVFMLTFLGAFIGIEEIVIPVAIFYIALVFTVSLLSTFIAGTLAHEYVVDKYFTDFDLTKRMACAFFVFLSMILLTNIPKVGIYMNMIFMIVSMGAIISYILKKEKNIKVKNKK